LPPGDNPIAVNNNNNNNNNYYYYYSYGFNGDSMLMPMLLSNQLQSILERGIQGEPTLIYTLSDKYCTRKRISYAYASVHKRRH